MSRKRIIVSVTNDLYTDQRVRKVCEFLCEHGADVTLVGRLLPNSKEMPATDYKTVRFPLWFKKGPLFYANYNLRLFLFLLMNKADILVSNDLDTLHANRWAKLFNRKATLVYDSHELYTETPELVNRPFIQKFWERIERRSIKRVNEMYTVTESIADYYRTKYKRDVKVVRNIGDRAKVQLSTDRKGLGLPEDQFIFIMQGAGINMERGAEEMAQAIQYVDGAVLAIVGHGDAIPALETKVREKNWSQKVLFFGKRPYEELLQFTMLSDAGVSMDKDTNMNYRFALGNKIFDYINSGIPLFVSDLPEIARIVAKYEIGVICPSHDIDVIASKMREMVSGKEQLSQMRENTIKASKELTWENEKKVLEEIYLPLLNAE